MFTLRCTQRLIKYIAAAPMAEGGSSTTALGDWYANLIPTCRGGVIICTNENTLLTVVLPLFEDHHPFSMFTMRVYNLFKLIGVPDLQAHKELEQMTSLEIRKTLSRKVLGCMNEIASIVQLFAEQHSAGPLNASDCEERLAKNIFSYTKYETPTKLVMGRLVYN